MKSSGNSTVKSIIIMTTKLNEKRFDGVAYVTPSILSLDIKNEGVLCGSFGEANQAGKMLSEDENSFWNF